MPKRWLVVLEATRYTRIYGQQQLGKCLCVAGIELLPGIQGYMGSSNWGSACV